MKRCSGCGAEIGPNQKFCPQCGCAVPQETRCPSCGAVVADGAKFCCECGRSVDGSGVPDGSGDSGSAVGGHAVVGGDVTSTVTSSDSHNVSNTVSNTTYVTQSDETKKVVWCEICGKALTVVETYRCPKCGKSVCARHYDETARMCVACRDADGKPQTPTGQTVAAPAPITVSGSSADNERSRLIERLEKLWARAIDVKNDSAKRRAVMAEILNEDQENPEVQYYVAEMFACGWLGESECQKARSWHEAAARGGNFLSAKMLGKYLGDGSLPGFKRDLQASGQWYERAYELGEKAAVQGNARDMRELGKMYRFGYNAESKVNFARGVYWLEKASAVGDAEAQYELAGLYEKGEGVPKDASRAVELAIASARGSFGRGCRKAGWYYEHGVEGVLPVDKKEALKWYRRVVEILPGKKCLVEDAIRRLS